jgi:uncharacterized damage-inducible protein DinB
MMTEGLLFNFGRNMIFLREKTEGLTHAESVLQPPWPGLNCLNWQVGHIATFRNRLLRMLGEEPTLDAAIEQRYVPGSAPVLGDEPGIGRLDELLRAIEAAQERIVAALPTMTAERAAEHLSAGQFAMNVGEWVMFYLRHEAYHIGQLHAPYAQAMAARGGA